MIYKITIMCLSVISGICMTAKNSEISSQKIMAVIDEYSKEIESKKNIERRSYGFHATGPDKIYNGKIHAIDLGYSIDKNLKYDEARKLFYEVADGLIDAINSHKEIGEYFYHYPIGYEDLDISLSFDYENKGHLKKDDIDSIYISDNEICYFIIDKEDAPNEIQKQQVSPEIYILKGFGSKTHAIRKQLPETD